jgi:hypothetical protein
MSQPDSIKIKKQQYFDTLYSVIVDDNLVRLNFITNIPCDDNNYKGLQIVLPVAELDVIYSAITELKIKMEEGE